MTDAGVEEAGGRVVVERPTLETATSVVESALESGCLVSIVGRCSIGTDGGHTGRRGNPTDDVGLVLVKPDGTVVIHGRTGEAPRHAIGPSDDVRVTARGGSLLIEVGAGPGRERVTFEAIELLASVPDDDGGGALAPRRDASEDRHERLRERLLADPDLVEPGFRPLSTERETAAGPVDLYGRDADGRAVVVEIKSHRAGPAAVGQLDRYVAALRRDLHADASARGILVAPSATDRTRRLLAERGLAFRAVQPADNE